ncbi:MAG: Hsp33 family molecular chaperone HslO, partial [Pseudomonadota bacterium]
MDDQLPPSDQDQSGRLAASFQNDTDIIQPFQLEATNLRGRLVRLDEVLDDILGRHDYPVVIGDLLAEALTVTVVLSSALKYRGIFTLQTRGDGPVPMLVTDV